MKILVTDQTGEEHELEGLEGWRVMEVIRDWGLDIKAECGGSCTCATCHVWVDPEWYGRLPGPSEDEEDLIFSTVDQKPTSRLSCQILLNDELDGLKVTIVPSAARDAG
ncbi:MAG TPA: 2Fe-2S iron-sulfur cluster-binding protein [Alphaproteobacteria bacterium]|nr:2Fe-2S iron-sulfur cluster-binding protein [Alphaproteobacteria bacterium]